MKRSQARRTKRDQGGYYGVAGALRDRGALRRCFGPDREGRCGLCGGTRWFDVGPDVNGKRVLRCAGCSPPLQPVEIFEGSYHELRRQTR